MKELTALEIEQVSGGFLITLTLLGTGAIGAAVGAAAVGIVGGVAAIAGIGIAAAVGAGAGALLVGGAWVLCNYLNSQDTTSPADDVSGIVA